MTGLSGVRFTLDATTSPLRSDRRVVPDAVVITFWIQFRNESVLLVSDLVLLRRSFTDGTGAELQFDDAPATVVGRTDRVVPGAGFVIVARHTAVRLAGPRRIRARIDVRGDLRDGVRFGESASLELVVDATHPVRGRVGVDSAGRG